MRFFVLLGLLVPAITHAQPAMESRDARRWSDPELGFGVALLGAGYVTSVAWDQGGDLNEDALYVPIAGPWLVLFSLPDCEGADVFCAHGNATRSVLLVSGAAQFAGTVLALHALFDRDEEERVLIAPSAPSGGPGVTLRGWF
jgi:hypothetical protein